MIQLHEVTKHYGDTKALDGISLHIEKGCIFGFLGPNGAGKTTLIRILTGICPPTSGQVLINGFDILKEPEKCKRITGYVPDRPFVYEKLRGFEFVDFILELYEVKNEKTLQKAHELFELFEIADAKYRMIENYSHGMKQKLVIICSLLPDPELIVIDEPMVGLDPGGALNLKKLLRKMVTEENKTVFLSTHTMSVAEEICDQIAIINHGKIAAIGTMQEFRQKTTADATLENIFLTLTREQPSEPAPIKA